MLGDPGEIRTTRVGRQIMEALQALRILSDWRASAHLEDLADVGMINAGQRLRAESATS